MRIVKYRAALNTRVFIVKVSFHVSLELRLKGFTVIPVYFYLIQKSFVKVLKNISAPGKSV